MDFSPSRPFSALWPTSLKLGPILLLSLLPVLSVAVASADDGEGWQEKVDSRLLEKAGRTGTADFIVVLKDQADVGRARYIHGKEAKGRFVFEALTRKAAETQGSMLRGLRSQGAEARGFWIANMIHVRGRAELLESLARRHDVARIEGNPLVSQEAPGGSELGPRKGAVSCPSGGVETSISHTLAPSFWAAGVTGEGVVIGGQDTGYDWDHPSLLASYRGWNGVTAQHAYHWHDAIHDSLGVCGFDSPAPCDDHGHGTHTMGTMVGAAGATQIGMAPGAKWIGCRNMDIGNGTPVTYAECFQWFLAPTDGAGENPQSALAPDVINNSWSCPPSEGCTDVNVLKTVVENLRAAGIVIVVSAGNSGSSCSTVAGPAAIYEASFTVGATDVFDVIAGFSSRGPVTVDGSNRLKPDISAPGVAICSARVGGGYYRSNGTSMAGPHVAGLVALLISAQPCLRGEVDLIEQLIRDTAVPRTNAQTCGGLFGGNVPNHTYGWGAIRAVLPDASVCPAHVFADGFESGDITAWQ